MTAPKLGTTVPNERPLPPEVEARVRRTLDAEARRLLAEALERESKPEGVRT
jgi:hypothetical protein